MARNLDIGPGINGTKEANAEKTVPGLLAIVGFCLAGLLLPLLLFSLQGLSLPTAGQAFGRSLCLGHPLTGLWLALTISPHSWGGGVWAILAFLTWPLEWALYGFLLDYGRRRSPAVAWIAVILMMTLGLILIGLACYALRIQISTLTLQFALVVSIAGIALISLGINNARSVWG